MRAVHAASINDWGAIAWSPSTGVVQATHPASGDLRLTNDSDRSAKRTQ
jgi:hypothetical protein